MHRLRLESSGPVPDDRYGELDRALKAAATADTSGDHAEFTLLLASTSLGDEVRRTIAVHAARGTRVYVACERNCATAEDRWDCLGSGASDVLDWSSADRVVREVVERLTRSHAIDQTLALPAVREHIVGASPAWRRSIRSVVEAARFTTTPILLMGESGTGKELLARLVHTLNTASTSRSLIVLDCSTIVPELSGSEFFGHERGSYTGAIAMREGAFALADGGTLFLDEIGELPLSLQAQLLRAIEERSFKKVGSNTWQRAQFRLVCATNRDLQADVRQGRFRADLYARIASWVCVLPPLRDRREDILPLAKHFLRVEDGSPGPELSDDVGEFLVQREYEGNVRELRLLMQRIAQRHAGSGPITLGDIPEADRPRGGVPSYFDERFDALVRNAVAAGAGLRQITRAAAEAAHRAALSQCGGRTAEAARALGVTPRALQLRQRVREPSKYPSDS